MSSPTITGTLKSTVSSELTAVLSPARTAMGAAVSPQPGQFTGTLGAAALRGYSAYDLAVKNGFTGTPEEWLASLKGADAVLPDFRASASHTGEPLSQPDVEVRSSGETDPPFCCLCGAIRTHQRPARCRPGKCLLFCQRGRGIPLG